MNTFKKLTIGILLGIFMVGVSGINVYAEPNPQNKPGKKRILKKAQKEKVFRKARKHRRSKIALKKTKAAKPKAPGLNSSIRTWLKRMKKRVSRSVAKHNQLVAVGATRGNETPDSPPLFWAGKQNQEPVDVLDLHEFDSALDMALKGQKALAIAKLEKIMRNPDSPLFDDAKVTIQQLQQ